MVLYKVKKKKGIHRNTIIIPEHTHCMETTFRWPIFMTTTIGCRVAGDNVAGVEIGTAAGIFHSNLLPPKTFPSNIEYKIIFIVFQREPWFS